MQHPARMRMGQGGGHALEHAQHDGLRQQARLAPATLEVDAAQGLHRQPRQGAVGAGQAGFPDRHDGGMLQAPRQLGRVHKGLGRCGQPRSARQRLRLQGHDLLATAGQPDLALRSGTQGAQQLPARDRRAWTPGRGHASEAVRRRPAPRAAASGSGQRPAPAARPPPRRRNAAGPTPPARRRASRPARWAGKAGCRDR